MTNQTRLLLEPEQRTQLWEYVTSAVEHYLSAVDRAPVAPAVLDVTQIRSLVERFNFEESLDPLLVVSRVVEGLWQYQVHTPHPRYFGLFNPAPTTMSIAADTLVAAFNPQLAAWSHSPLAAEMERHLVHAFATRFGYGADQVDGTFTAGGAEANHTAVLTALVHTFPLFSREGVRSLPGQPVFYVSAQSHHSFVKAARFCGLGSDAVRQIPTDIYFAMDVEQLRSQITRDRQAGCLPFMVVATAGTTSAGIVEPIQAIADVAAEQNTWFHVDAAWGGLAIMVPELRYLLNGVERADSITFDAHKKLSVSMSAGLFLTRHPNILAETCRISTDYMPHDAVELDIVDPYVHSMQWSRRFIGPKVFLSLAVAGWEGYAEAIRQQVKMGDLLRAELQANHWKIVNQTPLPVVCFVDANHENSIQTLDAIASEVVRSGSAWISTTRLDANTPVLRACVTNYRSTVSDIHALVHALEQARQKIAAK